MSRPCGSTIVLLLLVSIVSSVGFSDAGAPEPPIALASLCGRRAATVGEADVGIGQRPHFAKTILDINQQALARLLGLQTPGGEPLIGRGAAHAADTDPGVDSREFHPNLARHRTAPLDRVE